MLESYHLPLPSIPISAHQEQPPNIIEGLLGEAPRGPRPSCCWLTPKAGPSRLNMEQVVVFFPRWWSFSP